MKPEDQETIQITPLQEMIQRLLTDYHQVAVVLESADLLSEPERRNRLWRGHLHSTESRVPETVIIKQVRPDGYAPSDPDAWDTSRFFRDWAGAEFINAVAREAGHGPAFYGGDIERGFIILEDMGEHTSLVEPLLKGDTASAREALVAFARRLAQMHASAFGKEEAYREIQRQISPAWAAIDVSSPSGEKAKEERAEQIAGFAAACAQLDIEAGEVANQELEKALSRVTEPGPFTTFIHGDPCPDNVFYHAPELRLIDFEFSSFSHALRDGLYGRLPFPTCWCANTVPAEVVQQMETTYRAEFAVACPEILDEARFAEETAVVAAYWMCNTLRWEMEGALKQDGQWGIAGMRARILSRLAVLLDSARNANQMPALSDVCANVLAHLENEWPEAASLPIYPAFRTDVTR